MATIRLGVLNIMNAVTINASRDVLIPLLGQRRSMHTLTISVINGTVAFGACLGDGKFEAQQNLARLFIGDTRLRMRVMAIRTDCRIGVPRRQRLLMNTIQSFLILLTMTLLAGGIHFQ